MKSLSVVVESPSQAKRNGVGVLSSEGNPQAEEQESALDFITCSSAVKGLFLLPYAADKPVSVAVHNLGGTLLLDSVPDEEPSAPSPSGGMSLLDSKARSRKQIVANEDNRNDSPENIKATRSLVTVSSLDAPSEALTVVSSVIQTAGFDRIGSHDANILTNKENEEAERLGLASPDEYAHRYIPASPEPREYLSWKFHDMNLLVGSDALIYRSTNEPQSNALVVRVEDAGDMKALLARHQQLIESGTFMADRRFTKLEQQGKPSYAEATRKTLQHIEDEKHRQQNLNSSSNQTNTSQQSKNDDIREVSSFATPDFDKMRLQTCIVAARSESVGSLLSNANGSVVTPTENSSSPPQISPVSTVLDTYLDNIMANVPQLALCLREKGFIQSVKLLNTETIPSRLMNSSTFDTSKPFEVITESSPADEVFSPQIMEMNASALLRFLKSNCSKDNATYLMRREAGQTNIQLYDISSISAQRQRKWIWWLAMISYRFANRLRHVSQTTTNKSLQRSFRDRQRSLLQNTLDLLEALADMNGNAHESLVAAVMENLADTFLSSEEDDDTSTSQVKGSTPNDVEAAPSSPPPVTSVSPQQPYAKSTVDALHKAHDHLTSGIKVLWRVLDTRVKEMQDKKIKHSRHAGIPVSVQSVRWPNNESDATSSDSDDEEYADDNILSMDEIDPVATQLFGLHRKLVNVSLRLAEIHLRNYYSSSAMQALRTAARRIADSLYLVELRAYSQSIVETDEWIRNLKLQYTWLWEHCGHFARSYAADSLWRDRGHASGDDIVSVLQDVEAAFIERDSLGSNMSCRFHQFTCRSTFLTEKSPEMLTLNSLSGIVDPVSKTAEKHSDKPKDDGVCVAKDLLGKQKTLQRDQRIVLVAACISYSRAIEALNDFAATVSVQHDNVILVFDKTLIELLYQRFGDACNELGKILLNELRSLLTSKKSDTDDDDVSGMAANPLLSSAEFWFLEGLHAFQKSHDLRNLALLRCNLCQCCKLRANSVFAKQHHVHASKKSCPDSPSHAEICLQEGANHLQAAHELLGQRDVDPTMWDMVSGELAATFLVLGVRRRQSLIGSGNIPVITHTLRIAQGKEASIVEPFQKALKIYEQMGDFHQAAAAHYQLALFYSKIWTCQRDEAKTREKLGSAFKHYSSAFGYFSQFVRGNEVTFCLLCLDLASLYSSVSGEECLNKALARCLDTADAFSLESILAASANLQTRDEWLDKMQTMSSSVEERVFKLLRSLIKIEEEGKISAEAAKKYKDLYRLGLQAKMTAATKTLPISVGDTNLNQKANELLQLRYILTEIASHNGQK